jgi:hypothetical protein
MWMLFAEARTRLILFAGLLVFLLSLFCVAGVVRPRTVVAGLKRRFRLGHQAREEIYEFCRFQLQLEQAESPDAWWQVLCRTADQLDFAWALMSATDREGNIETHLWRRPGTSPTLARVTVVKVPVQAVETKRSIEVAVLTNGSVEGAIRRASVFGRLVDECRMPTSGETACALDPTSEGPPLDVGRSLLTHRPVTARLDYATDRARQADDSSVVGQTWTAISGSGRTHNDA